MADLLVDDAGAWNVSRLDLFVPLFQLDRRLERRICALIPESYVQYCRACLMEARLEENNDLVLFEGHWEDEFPF